MLAFGFHQKLTETCKKSRRYYFMPGKLKPPKTGIYYKESLGCEFFRRDQTGLPSGSPVYNLSYSPPNQGWHYAKSTSVIAHAFAPPDKKLVTSDATQLETARHQSG